jgi:hypothetical protein
MEVTFTKFPSGMNAIVWFNSKMVASAEYVKGWAHHWVRVECLVLGEGHLGGTGCTG